MKNSLLTLYIPSGISPQLGDEIKDKECTFKSKGTISI
jgi:hypothetical protein